jgi:hypothetical protein
MIHARDIKNYAFCQKKGFWRFGVIVFINSGAQLSGGYNLYKKWFLRHAYAYRIAAD